MPTMNEWEKSKKLTGDLRNDIRKATLQFCFTPLFEIFEELYIVLAWDLYFEQTPLDLYTLYSENKGIMGHLVTESSSINIDGMSSIPTFEVSHHQVYQLTTPLLPIQLPLLTLKGQRYSSHQLTAPSEGNNKKERALYSRYKRLKTDIEVFKNKVKVFNAELNTALNNCTTTKQFCEQNPEFEGYMKQSLKKFYNDTHPSVIESLNSAMDVRKYASLTSGHRLQAYQASMLAQLQPLELRHTQVLDAPQA